MAQIMTTLSPHLHFMRSSHRSGGTNSTDSEPMLRHQFTNTVLALELDTLHLENIPTNATVSETDDSRAKIEDNGQLPRYVPVPQTHISTDDGLKQEQGLATIYDPLHVPRPFQKWMKSLRRRATKRHGVQVLDTIESWQRLVSPHGSRAIQPHGSMHEKSSSGSSFGFVSAIRSASVSLASVSTLALSRRNTRGSHCLFPTDRSSRASALGPRASEDSAILEKPLLIDEAAVERSLQRRRILEELITTEEGYIGDVRFLLNASSTLKLYMYISSDRKIRSISPFWPLCLRSTWACGHLSTKVSLT